MDRSIFVTKLASGLVATACVLVAGFEPVAAHPTRATPVTTSGGMSPR